MDTTGGLTERIIHCIITVHQTLGPGFREKVYRNALLIELAQCGLAVEAEKQVVIRYGGCDVGRHRLDLVVEDAVIIELKVVEQIGKAHYAQVRSYLRATDLRLALLVNFAANAPTSAASKPPAPRLRPSLPPPSPVPSHSRIRKKREKEPEEEEAETT